MLTMDGELGELPVGDVLIEDGGIEAVAPSLEIDDAEVLDASGCVVMPGFVDTHTHSEGPLLTDPQHAGVVLFRVPTGAAGTA